MGGRPLNPDLQAAKDQYHHVFFLKDVVDVDDRGELDAENGVKRMMDQLQLEQQKMTNGWDVGMDLDVDMHIWHVVMSDVVGMMKMAAVVGLIVQRSTLETCRGLVERVLFLGL